MEKMYVGISLDIYCDILKKWQISKGTFVREEGNNIIYESNYIDSGGNYNCYTALKRNVRKHQ